MVLAGLAFVLGARLGYGAAAQGSASGSFLGLAFLATAVAAAFGAASHGLDPRTDREQRERCWRASLHAIGFAGAATIAAVAFFTARGPVRMAILVVAGLKLIAYLVTVARRPVFRAAAADYGGALALLLAAALYAMARWHALGMGWLVAGVAVSLIAVLVQVRRVALHRHFNHNDLLPRDPDGGTVPVLSRRGVACRPLSGTPSSSSAAARQASRHPPSCDDAESSMWCWSVARPPATPG